MAGKIYELYCKQPLGGHPDIQGTLVHMYFFTISFSLKSYAGHRNDTWLQVWTGRNTMSEFKTHMYMAQDMQRSIKGNLCMFTLQQQPLTDLLDVHCRCAPPCCGLWQSFLWACDHDISPQLSLQLSIMLLSLMSTNGRTILFCFYFSDRQAGGDAESSHCGGFLQLSAQL